MTKIDEMLSENESLKDIVEQYRSRETSRIR
jgi:hypothetical protein